MTWMKRNDESIKFYANTPKWLGKKKPHTGALSGWPQDTMGSDKNKTLIVDFLHTKYAFLRSKIILIFKPGTHWAHNLFISK